MSAEGNKARTVLHADESFRSFGSGNFWVVAITEDEPGFSLVSQWPTLEGAKAQADGYNAHLGLTDDEIRAIRISSLRASFATEDEVAEGNDEIAAKIAACPHPEFDEVREGPTFWNRRTVRLVCVECGGWLPVEED